MFNFMVIPMLLVIFLISQPIYFQKIVTIGRRSHRRGNCRHKKALAGRAGGYFSDFFVRVINDSGILKLLIPMLFAFSVMRLLKSR